MYGYSARAITCSVVRKDAPLTIARFAVSCSLRNPSTRDHSATYGDGAYCACSATSFATAFAAEMRLRSSSICRSSSVRFSSRRFTARQRP